MDLVLLGTAAGGGFPQWNCWCPTCRAVREDPAAGQARTQSSAAVTIDCERWFLLNASPDVHRQLTRLTSKAPTTTRHVPVEGIVVTDAELDHTLGITLLREARSLQVIATSAVRAVLERDSRILPVTEAFAEVKQVDLPLGRRTELRYRSGERTGLSVEAFSVPAGPPRFAREEIDGHTVGLMVRDEGTGRSCAFVPGCGGLEEAVLQRLAGTDLVLFDGTFWSDDELIRLGIGDRTARQMDHLPVSGPGGSLQQLRGLPRPLKVYTHINNTNPMLLEASPERRAVVAAGLAVGVDGMRFTV